MMSVGDKRMSVGWSLALFVCALMLTSVVAQETLVPTLEMDWNTIDVGGGISVADGFSMEGTIGQIDAVAHNVVMSGGGFEFVAGFWPGVRNVCLADVAPESSGNDGAVGDGVVNVLDLLAIINHWNANHWLYDIAPLGGDGTVDVLDLIAVLNAWGTCP